MPTRRIFFNQLALDARIGILEHELRATQPLHIDAEFDVDITQDVHDQNIHTVLNRSEENTSELQTLMRISYAVISLKKNITYAESNIRVTIKVTHNPSNASLLTMSRT